MPHSLFSFLFAHQRFPTFCFAVPASVYARLFTHSLIGEENRPREGAELSIAAKDSDL